MSKNSYNVIMANISLYFYPKIYLSSLRLQYIYIIKYVINFLFIRTEF